MGVDLKELEKKCDRAISMNEDIIRLIDRESAITKKLQSLLEFAEKNGQPFTFKHGDLLFRYEPVQKEAKNG
jgi:hypothetical protein